jgi:phage protein D
MVQAPSNQPPRPTFAVSLNGAPVGTDLSMWITSVVVEDELDIPGMFTIELISKQTLDGPVPWTDDPRLVLGAEVEISLGWDDVLESLMVGEITALEPNFVKDQAPKLVVRGFDRRHRLNRTRRTRSFVGQKDSDIVAQIASQVGIAVQATDSGVTHEYVVQASQTDLEFLQQRARRMRYELAMSGEVMLFRPAANAGSTVATLELGDDELLDFQPRMSLLPLTGVTVVGWDQKEKQIITASAGSGAEVSKMEGTQSGATVAEALLGSEVETLIRTPVASQAEADQIAVGRFNEAVLDFIRGEGRALGRTDLRAGNVIRLSGLGARFSGQYYLTSVTHYYSSGSGYYTDFRAQRNAS